jgi:hypothetical protein
MTRKEERIHYAMSFQGKGMDNEELKEIIRLAVLDGATWADANPSEENIAMYLGKKGWPLSTYGIPTYEEAAKTLYEYYEYKRKQWIEKAKKWFEEQNEWFDPNGIRHCGLEDFEDFVNYMEGE